MKPIRGPRWFERLGRASWLAIGIFGAFALVGLFFYQFSAIINPLVLATFIAIGFAPAVDWLEDRGIKRSPGAIIVVLGIAALLIGTGFLVAVGIGNNIGELSKNVSEAANEVADLAGSSSVGINVKGLESDLSEIARSAVSSGLVGDAVGSVAAVFSGLFLGTMMLYYLLRDGKDLVRSIVARRQPGEIDEYADVVLSSIARIRGFLAGATINAAAQGAFVAVGMAIFGIPLAFPIGLVIFLTAFVPYIGAFIGGFFAVAMGLAEGGLELGLVALVIVILGSGVLQNLLQPVLTGNKLELHPMVVLLVTFAGGGVAGLIGFILAAPLAAIVRDIYVELKKTGYFNEDDEVTDSSSAAAQSP